MCYRLVLVIFFLLPFDDVQGQPQDFMDRLDSIRAKVVATTEDSRVKALDLMELSYQMSSLGRFDTSAVLSAEALRIAKILESDTLISKAYSRIMFDKLITGFDENHKLLYDTAMFYAERAQARLGMINLHVDFGYYLGRYGSCPDAIGHFAAADSLTRLGETPSSLLLKTRIRYCGSLRQCDVFALIPDIVRETIPVAVKEKEWRLLASLYDLSMTAYSAMAQQDSARVYLEKFKDILPVVNRPATYGMFYNNAAEFHYNNKEYQEAYDLLQLGLALGKKRNSPPTKLMAEYYGLAKSSLGLGKLAEGENNLKESNSKLEESKRYFEIVLPFFSETEQVEVVEEIYTGLAEINASLGNYEQSYKYWRSGQLIRDSLKASQHHERIEELSVKFDTERIKRELAESELSLYEAERRADRNRLVALGLVSLLALSSLLLLYLRSRRQRKELEFRQQQAELRYSLLRAQMNPHFIFNSLNAIQSFFSGKRFELGNEYLGMFSQLVRRILEQTGQASISLHEELETLRIYLDLEQLRMGEMLSYAIHVSPEVEMELLDVPPLVLQPFVENAIWHGIAPKNGAGRIDIYLNYDERLESLHCIIEDDGMGMHAGNKPDNGHRSQGVDITRRRLGKGGRIDIRNRADQEAGVSGVRTELVIPLKG
ncbi:sensor histidine kinase [Neolewinella persica]|uniref:sensor histidine kinase n=1 Tax=Neolewinella persica TaxID=70998 RepID=UPI00039CB6F6|nr:histidine kinase [Neolewinella persica]